jgi:hypothetical protein
MAKRHTVNNRAAPGDHGGGNLRGKLAKGRERLPGERERRRIVDDRSPGQEVGRDLGEGLERLAGLSGSGRDLQGQDGRIRPISRRLGVPRGRLLQKSSDRPRDFDAGHCRWQGARPVKGVIVPRRRCRRFVEHRILAASARR